MITLSHIRLDERGVAWIGDTNVKVIEVIMDWMAYGWSPEEIHYQNQALSLAQIHAAISFYHDNSAEIDAEIARSEQRYESLREASLDSPARRRLRGVI